MALLLTPEERQRFAAWLENEITTSDRLMLLLQKQGSIWEPVVEMHRREIAASRVILNKLRSIESQTIG